MEDGECCMEDPCRDGGAEECGPAEGTICTNECKKHTCSCEEGFTMTPTGEDAEECVKVNIKTFFMINFNIRVLNELLYSKLTLRSPLRHG